MHTNRKRQLHACPVHCRILQFKALTFKFVCGVSNFVDIPNIAKTIVSTPNQNEVQGRMRATALVDQQHSVTLVLNLSHLNVIDAAESRCNNANGFSKVRAMTHTSMLGRVKQVIPLAAGHVHKCTNNRVVVLVNHENDMHVLFIHRNFGTDPEFCSSDIKMQVCDLHEASSVKHALGYGDNLDDIEILNAWRCNVQGLRPCNLNSTTVMDNSQIATFAVQWAAGSEQRVSCFRVPCANRFRLDKSGLAPRIKQVKNDTTGQTYSCYNENWRLEHLVSYVV